MKSEKSTAAVLGLLAVIILLTASAALAKKPKSGPNQFTTGCGDGTVVVTPETLWPPNHKMKTIGITYVETAPDADTISLTINSITDNELAEDPGTSGSSDACGPNLDDWSF